jgi:PAS domain S-box-containing protein
METQRAGRGLTNVAAGDLAGGSIRDAADPNGDERCRILLSGPAEYAIFLLDPQGLVTQWNVGSERLLGYSAGEILGRHVSLLFTGEDIKADLPARVLRAAVQKGLEESQSQRVRKDGSHFGASVLFQPLRDPQGRLTGFISFIRDISEPLQQQRSVEEALVEPPSACRPGSSERLSALAHDLNNMFQVIRNGAELLKRRMPADDVEGSWLADMVRRNSASAGELTEQLMELARRQPVAQDTVEVRRQLARSIERARRMLGERLAIDFVPGENAAWIAADPVQLECALMALIASARDALPAGGMITIEIVHSASEPQPADGHSGEGRVTIRVRDRGTGMTKAIMAIVHDPDSVVDPKGGLQLRTARVREFARGARGELSVESSPGQGTTVALKLPCAARSQTEPAQRTGAPEADAQHRDAACNRAPALTNLRALLVEDESLIAMHLEDLLDQLGCNVVGSASTVGEALDLARGDLDIAFLDVNVAGEQVYPVATALQARNVPFVFMSGYGQLSAAWRERPSVQKPFELEQLKQAIELALGRRG